MKIPKSAKVIYMEPLLDDLYQNGHGRLPTLLILFVTTSHWQQQNRNAIPTVSHRTACASTKAVITIDALHI